MSDEIITVRLSLNHASFLHANLNALASATRQAMARPGVEPDRRSALSSRAAVLEAIDDAVHGALLDPQTGRKPEPRPSVSTAVIRRQAA